MQRGWKEEWEGSTAEEVAGGGDARVGGKERMNVRKREQEK